VVVLTLTPALSQRERERRGRFANRPCGLGGNRPRVCPRLRMGSRLRGNDDRTARFWEGEAPAEPAGARDERQTGMSVPPREEAVLRGIVLFDVLVERVEFAPVVFGVVYI
jgi:hypothetical protein